jgi:hypothetical protein
MVEYRASRGKFTTTTICEEKRREKGGYYSAILDFFCGRTFFRQCIYVFIAILYCSANLKFSIFPGAIRNLCPFRVWIKSLRVAVHTKSSRKAWEFGLEPQLNSSS